MQGSDVKLRKKKYVPLVISGCSGVGKGTIINNLVETFPELFHLNMSYTTRKPRYGDTHGNYYFFL
jgi:guanylate kinase